MGTLMTVKRLKLLFAVMVLTALYACSPPASKLCMKAGNPVECMQVVQAGGDADDYLRYGMMGYMLMPSTGGTPTIAPDPRYRGWRRAVPSYQAAVRRSSATALPGVRPGYSGYRSVGFGGSGFRSSGFRAGRR